MSRRSGTTLFLMEQLIVVAIFAICAAACVRILTESYFMATDSRDLSNAIRVAESSAECYKAVAGDVEKAAKILGGTTTGASAVVYYNGEWSVCGESEAKYKMNLSGVPPATGSVQVLSGEVSVEKLTGEVILAFKVSARQ